MKKIILSIGIIAFISLALYYGCKKKDSDTTPVATCSDGIQNQGETGIDCGGPCGACPSVICNGKGSTSYWPLALNNQWTLSTTGNTIIFTAMDTITIAYTSQLYYEINENIGGTIYLRKAANGNIMQYNPNDNTEYVYIPASPTNNQTWDYPFGPAKRKVVNNNASVTTSKCTYSGCLHIQDINANGSVWANYYYKKGVGLIRTDEIWSGYIITDLVSVTLN